MVGAATSQWITPRFPVDLVPPAGEYRYQTSFDLTDFILNTVSLGGQWAADGRGSDILVNGKSTGWATAWPGYASFAGFSITDASCTSGCFTPGVNTLTFVVRNSVFGTNPGETGLRVDISGSGTLVPEPATWGLLGGGLLLIGLRRRVSKRG